MALPSPMTPLRRSPPLQTNAAFFELRLTGRITTRQAVDVGIGPTGEAVSITATQRLTVSGKGDYSFVVSAPAIDVSAGAGSESEPGLRRGAIVWQGFSPGRRILAAEAVLRVRESAPSLPLRLSLDARVNGVPLEQKARRSGALDLVLSLRNATAKTHPTFEGTGVVRELAGVLDTLRGTIERGEPFFSNLVQIVGGDAALPSRQARVEAPLDVRGTIRFPTGTLQDATVTNGGLARGGIAFRARLGDGNPLRLAVRVRGRARALGLPEVSLEVVPELEVSSLRPPRGGTWRRAVSGGLVRADGRAMLRTTIDTILRVALARQYQTFLSNPDAFARFRSDRTVYRYRSAPATATIAPAPPKDSGGILMPVLLGIGGVLAAGAALVVWAHS